VAGVARSTKAGGVRRVRDLTLCVQVASEGYRVNGPGRGARSMPCLPISSPPITATVPWDAHAFLVCTPARRGSSCNGSRFGAPAAGMRSRQTSRDRGVVVDAAQVASRSLPVDSAAPFLREYL